MIDLSIVIVNFKTPHLVLNCLGSIHAYAPASVNYEIIVVDNASMDQSKEVLEAGISDFNSNGNACSVKLIVSEENNGYAAGVNQGLSIAEGEVYLLLNPDVRFVSDIFSPAIAIFDADPAIGVLGARLLNPNLTDQFGGRRNYRVRDLLSRRSGYLRDHSDKYHLVKLDEVGLTDVDWVMGTGLYVRASCYKNVGGMDESYFLYFEDVDLCNRVLRSGYRVCCAYELPLVHDHERGSQKLFSKLSRHHLASMARYISKNMSEIRF